MKAESRRSFFLGAVFVTVASLYVCNAVAQQTQSLELTPLSETDAFIAITLAKNPTARLAAAEDFVAKYPNSKARLKAAELVVEELLKVQNPAVSLTLVERAKTIFTDPAERNVLKRVMLDAYASGSRSDEAFELAQELLKTDPDNLRILTQMTHAGAQEAKRKDRKHTAQALQYGIAAITIIESGKKPEGLGHAPWQDYQANLGTLYQQTGLLLLASGETEPAKSRLKRATELSPWDPGNYALLGRILNTEYAAQKSNFETMPEGNLKTETKKNLERMLDQIIEAYAKATALATGLAEYQTLLQQVVPDLTAFYQHRHQSTKGLQQLINQYRIRR